MKIDSVYNDKIAATGKSIHEILEIGLMMVTGGKVVERQLGEYAKEIEINGYKVEVEYDVDSSPCGEADTQHCPIIRCITGEDLFNILSNDLIDDICKELGFNE